MLTASKIESGRNTGEVRRGSRHGLDFVFSEVTSPSLPRKSFGRKTDEDPLEPFPRDTHASRERSFSHPILPEGTGKRRQCAMVAK